MNQAELLAHLDTMAIDPHFGAFVREAQRHGVGVQVVSDGLDQAITHILRRHGLGELPVFANQLVYEGERRWTLRTPHADAQCVRASGNCKCARALAEQQRKLKVLYVGDGSSDFCVAGRADRVLAKASLIRHCTARRIPHQPFRHFGEALALMRAQVAVVEVAT